MPSRVALKTEILADGFKFLEGPRWREGHLWMSGQFARKVHRLGPDGDVETLAEVRGRPRVRKEPGNDRSAPARPALRGRSA